MAASSNGKGLSKTYRGCLRPGDPVESDTLPIETPDLSTPIPILSFDEANDWLNGGHAFLVDVREKIQVLNLGRIKFSVRIPVYKILQSFALGDKDFFYKFCAHKPGYHDQIVVYCQSGLVAPAGAAKLRKMGYFEVGILAGGYKNWIANGGDIVPCPERNFHFSGFY
ncbi:unnamed protein product [Allacma fusca]|nr:unnamed protein product [Allacma fusca]